MQRGGGIWNGKIQTIKKRSFHNLEITSLSLSGNKITTIEEEAFVNLSQLKTLDRNQVKELNPRSSVGLSELDNFRVFRNVISKLQKNIFEFLENNSQ
jgi:Leucine-rich repeat (LRR) protein